MVAVPPDRLLREGQEPLPVQVNPPDDGLGVPLGRRGRPDVRRRRVVQEGDPEVRFPAIRREPLEVLDMRWADLWMDRPDADDTHDPGDLTVELDPGAARVRVPEPDPQHPLVEVAHGEDQVVPPGRDP